MPRRELLTEPQRLAFTEPAIEEREMVRHYTLSSEDLALIDRRRGDANRLGFAVLLCYLRFPGRTLRLDEQPPAPMLAFIAEQLALEPANFGDYAERDQTRREHLAEIQTLVGYRIFTGRFTATYPLGSCPRRWPPRRAARWRRSRSRSCDIDG